MRTVIIIMKLANINTIKNLLSDNKILAKKSFGQNFLIDKTVIDKIIEISNVTKHDNVLEIGPGLGVLTQALLENAKHVTSVELDDSVVDILKKTTDKYQNFELVIKNILKYKPKYKNYKIIANIPYNITGQILRYFLETLDNKPTSMTLMVQKEVAEKIVKSKGEHNLLSLSCQVFSKPQYVCAVSKEKFFPSPKIDSAIIHLELLNKPKIKDTEKFFELIHQAFQMKRKMLRKSLERDLGIYSTCRPQELGLEDWAQLITNYK